MPKDEKNNLNNFFEMIDLVEDDIAQMLEEESNQLGRYECLVICFNSLKLYCWQVGIKFIQIEDHYHAFRESTIGDNFHDFNIDVNSFNGNEVGEFGRILEEIENTLAAFETRCNQTEESFDEWNCVFIMYSCLRKYCDETATNYLELMNDVKKIQSDFKKDGYADSEA